MALIYKGPRNEEYRKHWRYFGITHVGTFYVHFKPRAYHLHVGRIVLGYDSSVSRGFRRTNRYVGGEVHFQCGRFSLTVWGKD